MTTTAEDVHGVLVDAAFGATPQRWPLPAATSARDIWLRAVAAGGQGRYASAFAELGRLHRCADPSLRSLALSTRASFLRQLGGHRAAAELDGRAVLESASADPAARADALTGL